MTDNLNLTPKQRDGIWRYIQTVGACEKHKDWPEVFIIYDIEDIENFLNENTVEEEPTWESLGKGFIEVEPDWEQE